MKIDLNKGFDEYAFKAQVLPGAIYVLPAIFITAFIADKLALVGTVVTFCMSFGLIYLVAHIVRTNGKKLELKLSAKWGGMPTTIMLRHRTKQNKTLFTRRRSLLESLIGYKLPSKLMESRNPESADEEYIAATKILIAKVRSKKARFPRVSEENANYGFRRNLLALRTSAIVLLLASMIAIGAVGYFVVINWQIGASLAILIGFLFFWVFMVKPSWIRESGQDYAERLFDALEEGLE